MRWNLNKLYTSFQSNKFIDDFKRIDVLIKDFTQWCETAIENDDNPTSKIESYLNSSIEIGHLFSRLMSFCSLSMSVDSQNTEAMKYINRIQQKYSNLSKPNVQFQKWLSELDNIDKILKSSDLIKDHSFALQEIIRQASHLMSEKEEVLYAKLKNTGSSAWSNLQNKLTSILTVDFEFKDKKEKLPLPVVRNFAFDPDEDKRKTAYESELNAYNKISESSAACLNSIKGEVVTMSKMRGFNSPLEMTLENSRMKKETLDAMLEAIKEFLPTFRRFYKKKADLLDCKNGLPFYNLFAPLGKTSSKYSVKEAREFIVDRFSSFSHKLADFAENAFNNNWIDSEPRKGKRGGAFCANLHVIGESRILANFTGNIKNVITLAHELGHGYHGSVLAEESFLNSNYPMPLAETASIFCETIVNNAVLKTAEGQEKLALMENYLTNCGQVIVDIFSRYLFETELFERRADTTLSVDELKTIMMNAQKEAYGDGLDHDFLHPYMWLNKPHYYYSGSNFYNFPYAFGLLFAKGLYAIYLEDKSKFIDKYDLLLKETGKNTIENVAKFVGVDITDKKFWRNSLNLIKEDIDEFIKL